MTIEFEHSLKKGEHLKAAGWEIDQPYLVTQKKVTDHTRSLGNNHPVFFRAVPNLQRPYKLSHPIDSRNSVLCLEDVLVF